MSFPNQNRKSPGFWADLIKLFRLAWRLIRDERVPFWTKLVPIGLVLYILSPIDLIPDVIPVLGQVDDLALLMLGTQVFIAISPSAVVQSHRNELDGVLHDESAASKDIIDGQ
jgi:uncharacterized membrane protein YkvA (DUF1232 family)